MLFKVDFENVYDSVDWGYLDSILAQMSFPVFWRKWIRECVNTATTSVLVNGSLTDKFSLQRVLRQGDPLSPFLFLLATEGLNILMKSLVETQLFTDYRIGEVSPVVVSHLQFADDTLLLETKSWASVRATKYKPSQVTTQSTCKLEILNVNLKELPSLIGEFACE